MTLADFVYHLDDETWVGIGLPVADGGGMVVFWVADYVGGYGRTMEEIGQYLDRDIYDDAYLEMFDDPETGERVPRIVIPVAPGDNTEGEDNGDNGD